jgi:hypothetical protein
LSPQNDEYALSWKHSVRLKYHVHQLFSPLLVYAILQGDGELFNCDCGSLPRLSSQVCHSPLVPLGPHEMGRLPSDHQRHKVIFAICLQGCFSTVSNAQQLPVGVGVQAIWHRTFHGTQNPFAWGHAAAGVIRNLRPFSHNVWGHTMGFGVPTAPWKKPGVNCCFWTTGSHNDPMFTQWSQWWMKNQNHMIWTYYLLFLFCFHPCFKALKPFLSNPP